MAEEQQPNKMAEEEQPKKMAAEDRPTLEHIAFNFDLTDVSQWLKICYSVHKLHRVLSCVVCFELCVMPVSLQDQDCSHACCGKCLEKRVKMFFPCRSCRDFREAELNDKIRSLLYAYKQLCALIQKSGFVRYYVHNGYDSQLFDSFLKILAIGASYGDIQNIPSASTSSSSISVNVSDPYNPSNEQDQPKAVDPFADFKVPKVTILFSGKNVLDDYTPWWCC